MAEPIAVISGVGPGTGAALARRFAAGGHRVAMLARDGERLAALEREIAGTRGSSATSATPPRSTTRWRGCSASSARRRC